VAVVSGSHLGFFLWAWCPSLSPLLRFLRDLPRLLRPLRLHSMRERTRRTSNGLDLFLRQDMASTGCPT
jgi:hypothetical protein